MPFLKDAVGNELCEGNTVFVVGVTEDCYVCDLGIMYLNLDTFKELLPVLKEFFSLIKSGVPVKKVFGAFKEYLTQE